MKETDKRLLESVLNDGVKRNFDTWQDLGDLKEKLVEKKLWMTCVCYVARRYNQQHGDRPTSLDGNYVVVDFLDWLLNPIRFCQLVVDWWKEAHDERK